MCARVNQSVSQTWRKPTGLWAGERPALALLPPCATCRSPPYRARGSKIIRPDRSTAGPLPRVPLLRGITTRASASSRRDANGTHPVPMQMRHIAAFRPRWQRLRQRNGGRRRLNVRARASDALFPMPSPQCPDIVVHPLSHLSLPVCCLAFGDGQ